MPHEFVNRPLSRVSGMIQDGDLLLYRSGGLIARMISRIGRGRYSHAAKVARWGDDLFVIDTWMFHGGDIRLLSADVRAIPGQIDVYGANAQNIPRYDAQATINYMRELVDRPYGWWSLLKAAFWHLPLVRLLVTPNINDEHFDSHPPYCSQWVAMAERIAGGVDVVPRLADKLTEPNDLARSRFYDYLVTLEP